MIPRKISLVITSVDNRDAKIEIVTDSSMDKFSDEEIERSPCLRVAYKMLKAVAEDYSKL